MLRRISLLSEGRRNESDRPMQGKGGGMLMSSRNCRRDYGALKRRREGVGFRRGLETIGNLRKASA